MSEQQLVNQFKLVKEQRDKVKELKQMLLIAEELLGRRESGFVRCAEKNVDARLDAKHIRRFAIGCDLITVNLDKRTVEIREENFIKIL